MPFVHLKRARQLISLLSVLQFSFSHKLHASERRPMSYGFLSFSERAFSSIAWYPLISYLICILTTRDANQANYTLGLLKINCGGCFEYVQLRRKIRDEYLFDRLKISGSVNPLLLLSNFWTLI